MPWRGHRGLFESLLRFVPLVVPLWFAGSSSPKELEVFAASKHVVVSPRSPCFLAFTGGVVQWIKEIQPLVRVTGEQLCLQVSQVAA